MLGRNVGIPIPLAWQPPTNPLEIQAYFDFFSVPCHQPLGTPPSNRVILNNANTVLGISVKPHVMQHRIHMTPPHGPLSIRPTSLPIDVEMR